MNALIANNIKTNMCLITIKLFIVRTILCYTVSNLYNNNYLFDILFCLQPFPTQQYLLIFFSAYNLFLLNNTC